MKAAREECLIDVTLAALMEAARAADMTITGDGRVSEADAAVLLGIEPDTLAKKRSEGKAPPSYRLSVGAGRISYRLRDLAAWIEAQRENF